MSNIDSEIDIQIGKKLFYGDAANSVTTLIDGTVALGTPEAEVGETEYTNDGSPNKTKQFKPSLVDPGKVKGNYKYQKTQYAAVQALFVGRTVKYWKVQTPDGATSVFQGFMTKHSVGDFGTSETPDVDFEIRVTGAVTFTPGSST